MDKIFKKWNPDTNYLIGDVVFFADKLYLATQDNVGIFPMNKSILKNAFNKIDNSDLVDELVSENNCRNDFPLTSNITYDSVPITFEGTPITFTDEELFNWKLV